MSKTLLITRPKYDSGTTYLFHWSKFVIAEAAKKLIGVLDLKEKKASRRDLFSYIEKRNPKLVVFNGHGSADVIGGHDGAILIGNNESIKLLSGKIIYARCCAAAKSLGRKCVEKGTLAFVGYKRDFFLARSNSSDSRPLSDKLAKLFLEPSNLVPISLIKGNTVESSYRKSQESLWRNFHYLLSSSAPPEQRDAAPFLWANRKNQTVLGDQSARF